jgi:hypothetical protein
LDEDATGITFRSRDDVPLDLVGPVLGLQQWWLPEAFDAVTDVDRA